jgi:hypothetical protein
MTDCEKCGKKIGFFSKKHEYEDNKGNSIIYCKDCHKKEEDKLKEEQKKERIKLKKKVLPIIKNFLTKTTDFNVEILFTLYKNNITISKMIRNVEEKIKMGYKSQKMGWIDFDGSGYDPADHIEENKERLQAFNQYKNEIDILIKLIKKKEIDIETSDIIEWGGELIDQRNKEILKEQEKAYEDEMLEGFDDSPVCQNCGKPLKSNSKFCKYCGVKQ